MPKWVSLKDLMENPSKYGVKDPRKLKIAYTPDKQSITLIPGMTGYYKAQTFETETDGHSYYPVIYKGKVYLVSGSVTRNELALRGKTGYEKGAKALKRHARTYGNKKLGAKGETWNQATIEILYILPKFLKRIEKFYWTVIKYISPYDFGLQNVHSSDVYGGNVFYGNGDRTTYSHTYSYAVRPLVSLPQNIQVDIENLDGTPLKLRLPEEQGEEREDKLSEELMQLRRDLTRLNDIVAKREQITGQMKELSERMLEDVRNMEKMLAESSASE